MAHVGQEGTLGLVEPIAPPPPPSRWVRSFAARSSALAISRLRFAAATTVLDWRCLSFRLAPVPDFLLQRPG
jgi:hypothetical protein